MKKEKPITKNKTFAKAYDDFSKMIDGIDIQQNGLTLGEYDTIHDLLKEMRYNENAVGTLQKGVAEWFKKKNFNVESDELGGWIIYITGYKDTVLN